MKIAEARKKCNNSGIYQLNKGESLADAMFSIDNKTARKGYKVKHDSGRLMTENEIISNENKEAFHRSFTPSVYAEEEIGGISDICKDNDIRENKKDRGVIIHCYYCGDCLRIDAEWSDGKGDYPEPIETIHCDGCMNDAISRMCM